MSQAMTLNFRLLGDATKARTTIANDRVYTAGPGQIVTVPCGDGEVCRNNGWIFVSLSAPTASRPAAGDGPLAVRRDTLLWNETLGKLIVFDGVSWRDPSTGAVV